MLGRFVEFAISSITVFGILWTPTISRRSYAKLCQFTGSLQCNPLPRHIINKVSLPPHACHIFDCTQCIKTNITYLLTDGFKLLTPSKFVYRHLDNVQDINSTSYKCHEKYSTSQGESCECEDSNCDGTTEFCRVRTCSNESTCTCAFTYRKPQLIAVTQENTLYNPRFLILETCLYMIENTVPHRRKLLEGESASFHQHNLTIKFNDPILTLPDIGRVILRNSEFEHIFDVPEDLMITIPFELLAYKTEITIIYLHSSGITVSGVFRVSGKSVCQLRQCFFCYEIMHHFKCFPTPIQYFLYIVLTAITLLFFLLLKSILTSIFYILKYIIFLAYLLLKALKLLARCSLLIGAFTGNVLRNLLVNIYAHLELHARANLVSLPMVLLTCILVFTGANGECNTHAVISSDLQTCETLQDGTKVCQLYTTSEISLPTISSESCLWFTDKYENQLFSLKIRLDAVKCSFHTERQYFTFPVNTKHISQVSCIFNRFCGRGVHCIKRYIGSGGIHFEAETQESRDFPGISACVPGSLGTGCTVLTRAACNFYRTWFEPQLLQSYEVSKIQGHKCVYHISVQHTENNTISRLSLTDSAYTNGIKITVLGAFDQPQLHIDDYFIQRVGRPSEAYLAPASKRNHPKAGEIGAIQANSSFTKSFIFDPDISQCDFFEDTLRCITAPNALEALVSSQEHALPLQRDVHLFQIQDDTLQSSLLISSAVRIQLHFSNYKIKVKANTICPKFEENEISATGCYNCPVLARITFSAVSTCDPGVVLVQFQEITVHTKAVQLSTTPQIHIIKFFAETRCYKEKLCLKSPTLIQCQKLSFCLDEPSVELLQLNTNYTRTLSTTTSPNWLDWLHLPNMNSSLFLLKFVGSTLFIICVCITIFSTVLTCCCRSR